MVTGQNTVCKNKSRKFFVCGLWHFLFFTASAASAADAATVAAAATVTAATVTAAAAVAILYCFRCIPFSRDRLGF